MSKIMRLMVSVTPNHNNTVSRGASLALRCARQPEIWDGLSLCPVISLATLPFKPKLSSAYIILLGGRISGNVVEPPQSDSARVESLVDIDFDNAAGFLGQKAGRNEAQHVAYYLSHAMMFCTGVLIEPHVVLTPASCVFGEKYKFEIFAGTHEFLENAGARRMVNNICMHKGYNHTLRWKDCVSDNLALLVLDQQFSFHKPEDGADYIINRIRYGVAAPKVESLYKDHSCRMYGWGSRRNGYLIPLLIYLYRMDVTVLPVDSCARMWNYQEKYLCIRQPACKDDVGSVIVCSGFAVGMMTSRLVDRPCGVGFIDLSKYSKFLTCGVDDSRDVIDHEALMEFDFTTKPLMTLKTVTTTTAKTTTTTTTKKPKEKEKKNKTTKATKAHRYIL